MNNPEGIDLLIILDCSQAHKDGHGGELTDADTFFEHHKIMLPECNFS
jgi:hypothetical protein